MGKGDTRRPTQVSDEQFASNWCAQFGHRMRAELDQCMTCGKTAAVIVEQEASR